MKREDYLLAKVAEEAAEVGQAAIKTLLFGRESYHIEPAKTNISELKQEILDLLVVIGMYQSEFGGVEPVDTEELKSLTDKKIQKVNYYYDFIGKVVEAS